MPDLRLAAWFLWMTPLLTALSSALLASCSAVPAAAASPDSAAVRKRRTDVFRADLTATLRCRARSLVLIRLIWDLMFATREPRCLAGGSTSDNASGRRPPTDRPARLPASVAWSQPPVRRAAPHLFRLPVRLATPPCVTGTLRAIALPDAAPWDDGLTVTTPAATDPARI